MSRKSDESWWKRFGRPAQIVDEDGVKFRWNGYEYEAVMDLHPMCPERRYRVEPTGDGWDVERVTDGAWVASFVDVADARQFCDAKNTKKEES